MKSTWVFTVALSGLAVAMTGAGCGHTRRADDTPVAAEKEGEDSAPKRAPARKEKTTADEPRKKAASPSKESSEDGPPLATGPEGLMTEGGVAKIQDRLRERELLKGDTSSGHWDEPTRTAMREFQRDNGLPATGMPDDVTVGKLGLKPGDVFRSTKK